MLAEMISESSRSMVLEELKVTDSEINNTSDEVTPKESSYTLKISENLDESRPEQSEPQAPLEARRIALLA